MARYDNDGASSQADTRYGQTFTDQHGRQWHANIEKRSGYPTGLFQPQFTAPWYPDQQYITPNERDRTRIDINYEAMLRSRMEAHEEYHRRMVEEAAARQWSVEESEDGTPVYDRKLLMIVGQPPRRAEPIIAAMQGNRWVLGLTSKVDERVVPFLESRKTKQDAVLQNLPDFSDPDEGEEEPVAPTRRRRTAAAA